LNTKKIIIAIDGYASTGKSTLAKSLSAHYGYFHIDTGAMYRAVTFYALECCRISNRLLDYQKLIKNLESLRIDFKLIDSQSRCFLNDKDVDREIRTMSVLQSVSEISAIKEVRSYLVNQQRILGKNKGVVAEGRDIGTVVFPNAECKLFLTATPQVRAKRRYKEMKQLQVSTQYRSVLYNLNKRDKLDKSRQHSPLVKAKDAIELNVSSKSVNQVFNCAKKIVDLKLKL